MTDIIDQIDLLIDEQLATGEPVRGFDFGDPQYPKCWHCGRAWHGLPVTERIAQMYAAGQFDEDYRVDSDDSRVLCRGSDFIGPMPEGAQQWAPSYRAPWLGVNFMSPWMVTAQPPATTVTYIDSTGNAVTGTATQEYRDGIIWLTIGRVRRWWRTTLPSGSAVTHRFSSLTMTVETGDNSQTFPEEDVRFNFHESGPLVISVLSEFAPDIGGTWEPITAPGVTEYPEGR